MNPLLQDIFSRPLDQDGTHFDLITKAAGRDQAFPQEDEGDDPKPAK